MASIVHKVHWREWRMSGIAYEVRDSSYHAPNRTMATMASGREMSPAACRLRAADGRADSSAPTCRCPGRACRRSGSARPPPHRVRAAACRVTRQGRGTRYSEEAEP